MDRSKTINSRKLTHINFASIKHVYERPRKWPRLGEDFYSGDDQISDVYLLPIRIANEPYILSFQYKVLNSIFLQNDILNNKGYVSTPNHGLTLKISAITFHRLQFTVFPLNIQSFII